jgi:hypothetical protein
MARPTSRSAHPSRSADRPSSPPPAVRLTSSSPRQIVVGGQLVDTGKLIEIDHLQAADGDPSSLITALLPTGHRRPSTIAGSVGSYVASCPWKSRLVPADPGLHRLAWQPGGNRKRRRQIRKRISVSCRRAILAPSSVGCSQAVRWRISLRAPAASARRTRKELRHHLFTGGGPELARAHVNVGMPQRVDMVDLKGFSKTKLSEALAAKGMKRRIAR